MIPRALPILLVFILASRRLEASDAAGCMAAGSSVAVRGARGLRMDVTGSVDHLVRGFSLAMGHDASRLELLRIEAGPLFADAELISQNITNVLDDRGLPHGEVFVILDFQLPFDHPPVDLSQGGLICTFVYDVRFDAPDGAAALHLGNREYGLLHREVSAIFVDTANQELYPRLLDGAVEVVSTPRLLSIAPGRGSLEGGTSVAILGVGLAGPPEGRVLFGMAEARVVEMVSAGELQVLSPPADSTGKVTLHFEGPLGAAEIPDAFEYVASVFVRGDCNEDAKINITDAIFALNFLFAGGASPTCKDACDVDDDGQVRISDAIRFLNYLFRGGASPESPFPSAGLDPTKDFLPCDLQEPAAE